MQIRGTEDGLYRAALARSAKVFFQNSDDHQLFFDERLVQAKVTDLLPGSGIDLHRFAVAPMPVVKSKFRFLLIARMLRDKGVVEFVEAAKLLRDRWPSVEFCLLEFVDVQNPAAISRAEVESWSVNKSKDDIDTGQYHFELNQIVLGHDQDGDQISSCVIEPAIQTLISSKQKRPQGAQQKIALDTFNSLMQLSKQTTPSIEPKLKLEVLEKAVGGNLVVEEKRKPERARAAINGLIALWLLTIKDGFITNT